MSSLGLIDAFLRDQSNWRFVLAALKGLRNGIVYGCRIRAPHALVMVFLFGKGTILQKLLTILRLTRTHAQNLGRFVFSYKLITGGLAALSGAKLRWHSAAAAALVGYFVFGNYNGVNMQINLYLLSRVTVGLGRLALAKGWVPQPPVPIFPIFASAVWGIVLFLFEYHPETLQPSLQPNEADVEASMTYLYSDSDKWTRLRDFLFVNKLPGTDAK